jgi:hypothetical protein
MSAVPLQWSRGEQKREWRLGAAVPGGVAAGTAGFALLRALERKQIVDPTLFRSLQQKGAIDPVVVVPGIMGSCLMRPDGTAVWLNLRNALGHYNLSLPFTLPLSECRDDLVPGPLLGTEAVMPRLFGFTEYADLLEILESGRFRPRRPREEGEPTYHVFSYDWRRDLVESARRLHETLESLAEGPGQADARFNVIGHSMGGLVAAVLPALRHRGAGAGGRPSPGPARAASRT